MSELTAVLLARYHGTAGYAVLAALLGGRHSSAYKLVFNELARVLHELSRSQNLLPLMQHFGCDIWTRCRSQNTTPMEQDLVFKKSCASPV